MSSLTEYSVVSKQWEATEKTLRDGKSFAST